MNNETVRQKFNEYLKNNFNPTLRIISDKIGIDVSYLVQWRLGKREISSDKLQLINNFIDTYDVTNYINK